MRIIFDQVLYDMRNKGNVALLQVPVARLKKMWPTASLEVLTLSPHLLKLYCPTTIPVEPDGRDVWSKNRTRYNFLHKMVPNPIWRSLFELREAIWRRKSSLTLSSLGSEPQLIIKNPVLDKAVVDKLTDGINEGNDYPKMVAGADLFVATGAQYMSDACRDDALQVINRMEAAIACGIPTVMVGQGFGPMKDPILVERSRTVLPKIDLIFIREKVASPQLLASLGVDSSRISLTGDDAIELAYESRTRNLGRDIGVGLRIARYTELDSGHIGILRTVLQTAARKYGCKLMSIPISHSAHEMDDIVLQKILEGYPNVSKDWRRFNSPLQIIKQVGGCRLVVAGTFHATVFALAQGIPAIGLAKSVMYMDKFLGLIDLFGAGCQVVRLDDEALEQNLTHAIEFAWASAKQMRPILLEAAEEQIRSGKAAYQRIYDLVEYRNSSRK